MPSRAVLVLLSLALTAVAAATAVPSQQRPALGFSFTDIAERAGLTAPTVYGGRESNRYLLETTGSGAAALDYDNDGWLDIFVVNGCDAGGLSAREGTNQPSLSESARRHVRRRYRQSRCGARRVGARRMRRRLRQ